MQSDLGKKLGSHIMSDDLREGTIILPCSWPVVRTSMCRPKVSLEYRFPVTD